MVAQRRLDLDVTALAPEDVYRPAVLGKKLITQRVPAGVARGRAREQLEKGVASSLGDVLLERLIDPDQK